MLTHILLILRLMLLTVSVYGYLRWIGNRVRMEFAPGIFFTSLCSVMFLAGILNILPETAWAVWGIGIFLTLHSLRKKESLKPLLCPGMVFFALSAVFSLFLLHGETFGFYDDFSHWGTVMKVIYTRDRFPCYADTVISFQSYPTGSASFLYFFLTISGITSEWYQMFWQAIFMLGLLTGMFAFVTGLGNLFASAVAWTLLLCCNGLNNLMVDTLLPVTAYAGLFLCFHYRNRLGEKWFWLSPYLVSLVSIKNSGILFSVLLLMYAFHYMRKSALRSWIVLLCVPSATLLLWQKHVSLVFDNGLNARHSMSVESITASFLKKDSIEILTVIENYLTKVFSLENPFLLLAILSIALAFALNRLNRQSAVHYRALLIFALLSYAIYMVGLLAMYLTTMPYQEAAVLAAFERYHRSILILLAGCAFLITSEMVNTMKWNSALLSWVLTVVICFFALFPGLWYSKPTIRNDFEQLIVQYPVLPEKRYCILLDEKHSGYSGYLQYMIRYLLNSTEMKAYSIAEFEAVGSSWDGYDYLICFGDSGELDEYLLRTFGSREIRVLTLPQP